MVKYFLYFKQIIRYILISLFFIPFYSCDNQIDNEFKLIDGDLLFQDMDCGSLCDAIENVTQGYKNDRISHVGIVSIENNTNYVIEAIGKGVVKTLIDSFLSRSLDADGNPKVIVGRLKDSLQNLIPKALKYAHQFIGKPYDQKFEMNDSAFYCSELIYRIFYKANNSNPVFNLSPMTYKIHGDSVLMSVWVAYFKDLNDSVPEGKPGCNPAGISRNKNIRIVHEYGTLTTNSSH